MEKLDERQIIFYDGDCPLCSFFVRLLYRLDRNNIYYYAPLSGTTAKQSLPKSQLGIDSVVLLTKGQVYDHSSAVIKALSSLGFPWALVAALKIIPKRIRDAIYRWVAKNRARLFKGTTLCQVPHKDTQRFLP